jgi:predicted phage terminase large subunit-like protein
MNRPVPRADIEKFTAALAEKRRRLAKAEHSTRGYRDADGRWCGGLLSFVRYFWHILEPGTPFVDGWVLEAICEHLEAVTFGEITNLLINVPPGFSKSLITNCFWPAWEWGPMELSHIRYVTFSYSSSNTQRDNQRFGDLVASAEFKSMYPEVQLRQNGMEMVSNYKHGWKLASSVTGSATGKRGNRAICDDLNNVKESESKPVMEETNRWFRESLSSRLNDMEKDAKIVIAQRVGESDVSGEILRLKLPYCHLMIQMEYEWQADDEGQPYTTDIGWIDPRWTPDPEDCQGALAWEERFSEKAVQALKIELGPFATAAQLQQTPEARGGGVLKREWWLAGEQYMDGNKFPPFSYVVASLDGAFDEKELNDPSALTIWGIFTNEHGYNRAMLVHAWAKRLQISGINVDIEPGEHESVYRRRAMPHWGLVEWVADTCNRFKADRLLIENKASGKPAAQSLQNSHGRQGWAIVLVEPKGDKYARGLAVQPSFSQGMIYAPERDWSFGDGGVVDECAKFPKGLHDDQYDSTTQAIKHLRDTGLLRSDEDRRAEELDAVRHKGAPKQALYPGFKRRQA